MILNIFCFYRLSFQWKWLLLTKLNLVTNFNVIIKLKFNLIPMMVIR